MSSSTYPDLYNDIESFAKDSRGMTFISKDDSRLMRLIAWLLMFVPGMNGEVFMERFTTHFSGKVFWARRYSQDADSDYKNRLQKKSMARTLSHEMVHQEDEARYGLWFRISYGAWRFLGLPLLVLLPICLGQSIYCAVGHFTGADTVFWWWNLWLCLILSALTLPPWPEPGRTHWELRGYAVSMWFDWRTRSRDITAGDYLDWYIDTFTGPNYYFMWWWRRDIRRKLERMRDLVVSGQLGSEIRTVRELEPFFVKHFGEALR